MTNVPMLAPSWLRRYRGLLLDTCAPATLLLFGLGGPALAQELQPRLGEPVPGLSPAELALFEAGRVAFDTTLTDPTGLGPVMNDVSCIGCHSQPVSGGFSTRTVTRFGQMASGGAPFDPLDALGGSLLQEQTIDITCAEVVPPEADVTAQRLTPGVFGIGLMESIVDQDILDNEANQPAGLSGFVRMNQPIEGGPARPGRFGTNNDGFVAGPARRAGARRRRTGPRRDPASSSLRGAKHPGGRRGARGAHVVARSWRR